MIDKLRQIQEKLKVPKSLHNSFGKYNYRNAETILEEFKPYEAEYKVSLVLSDTIEEIAGRVYVKATATLFDCESDKEISVTAYAREDAEKKGMDVAQVTGAASSYARKYALNGLFLLDDTKDPDSNEYKMQSDNKSKSQQKNKAESKEPKAKPTTLEECMALIEAIGYDNKIDEFCKFYKVNELTELTQEQLEDFFKNLVATGKKLGK